MSDIQTINAALEIVKLENQRFRVPGGYIQPIGFALRHPEFGYLGFKHKPNEPYIPIGGKIAFKAVLDAGGFLGFDDCIWIQPIK